MFSVVAVKSRTFSGLPYSANEEVCRRWEGEQPDSQPKLANGNIPYLRPYALFMNGLGWGEGILFFTLFFCEFKSSLVQESKLV